MFFINFSNSNKGYDIVNKNIYAGNVNWNKTKNNYNEKSHKIRIKIYVYR